ncbi:hypothetical protein E2C01_019516 [Portunus trituberculatus]|uniref:Uncharacterized protein n=1 Tax=Portunus trituberculatus TaxID=210409 RepID=A0A5B7DXF3_PORTR|nr:hypothetical protein [Portunus trituberculatus]
MHFSITIHKTRHPAGGSRPSADRHGSDSVSRIPGRLNGGLMASWRMVSEGTLPVLYSVLATDCLQ